MKNILQYKKHYCWMIAILLVFLQQVNLQAQTFANQSVLKLNATSNNSYFNSNIDLKGMLLDKGTLGEATIEFWARFQNNNQSLKLTLDAENDKNLSFEMFSNKLIFLKSDDNSTDNSSLDAKNDNTWIHYAYTFQQQNSGTYNIEFYVNGFRKKTFTGIDISSASYLYFSTGLQNIELNLTDIKAFNKSLSGDQINSALYLTFYNYSGSNLQNEIDNGLVADFSKAGTERVGTFLPELSIIDWPNTVQNGSPGKGSIVSQARKRDNSNIAVLADLSSSGSMPITSLTNILLSSSVGEYTDIIKLNWKHLSGMTNYKIYKNEVEIGSNSNVSSRTAGESLILEDKDALPGQIYTYKVKGSNIDNSNVQIGSNVGFIFPNGSLNGDINTQSNVHIADAAVVIQLSDTTKNGSINGSALYFEANSPKITIEENRLLKNDANKTIEFWYKNNEISDGNNTVFKLGQTEIQLKTLSGRQNIKFIYHNLFEVYYQLSGNADQLWHHYAFSIGSNGIEIFRDQISVGTNSSAFTWTSNANDNSEFYLNYSAETKYSLDEFRVWNGKRTIDNIKKYGPYVVDNNEPDLLLAYSFDMRGTKEIFNQAVSATKTSYKGISTQNLMYVSQPLGLKYVTYTNSNGHYEFNSIYSDSPVGNLFKATAIKANHQFSTANNEFRIKQSTIPSNYTKTVNFIDNSSLPVSGRIYSLVSTTIHPVVAGKSIAIDGVPVSGTDESIKSDLTGQFSISSSLGRHNFEVSNPDLTDAKNLNSLGFDTLKVESNKTISGKGYAYSKNNIDFANITLSCFVKPSSFTPPNGYTLSNTQTLLKWGKFELILIDNKKVRFSYDNSSKQEISLASVSEFSFVALSIKADGTYGLMIGDTYKYGTISGIAITAQPLYLGATFSNGATTPTANNLANLALIQLRNTYYNEINLKAIKNGDIIAGDETALKYSFEFDQEKGKKALSKTLDAKNNYLVLPNDESLQDGDKQLSYSKKYKYSYLAANASYNPASGSNKYSLNVVDPITSLDFKLQTRYGFIGNVVIPGDFSIGAWNGTIKRTDVTNPQFSKTISATNFDTANQIFLVDDLIPGQYQITLTNANNAGIKLESPIIDITKGWATYDFEYRAPLQLEVNVYKLKESSTSKAENDLKFDDFTLLNKPSGYTHYVVTQTNTVLINAIAFEMYGSNKSVVKGASITFSGGLLNMPSDSISVTGTTDSYGVSNFFSTVSSANFIAPYTRSFTIAAAYNHSNASQTIAAVIEGSRQNSSDFTVKQPVIDYVLHDPPGDGSSATLRKGTRFVRTVKHTSSGEMSFNYELTEGAQYNQTVITTVLGLGTSQEIIELKQYAGYKVSSKTRGISSNSRTEEKLIGTDISTSSKDNIVGRNADLFIGTGYLITVGKGDKIEFNQSTKQVDLTRSSNVANSSKEEDFVHSYYDIKNNMIPNYIALINAEKTDTSKRNTYIDEANKWIHILIENDKKLGLYNSAEYNFMDTVPKNTIPNLKSRYTTSFGERETNNYTFEDFKDFGESNSMISFDGAGSAITKSISNSTNKAVSAEVSFDFSLSVLIGGELKITGLEVKNKTDITAGTSQSSSVDNQTSTLETLQYILSDDDTGDRFAVDVRKDPNFGSPIFKTIGGRSMCPAERNTEIRTGVEIAADTTSKVGLIGEEIKFRVKIRNTATSSDNTIKTYFISPYDITSIPDGCTVKINGGNVTRANEVIIYFEPGETEKTVTISIAAPTNTGSSYFNYSDLKFLLAAPCENHRDIMFAHNADVYAAAGIKSNDYLYLNAEFYGPCISDLKMSSPKENWVVNGSSDNKLPIAFTVPGTTINGSVVTLPSSLTNINIEYALKGNNTGRLFKTISAQALKNMYKDNAFRDTLNTLTLPDGAYGFRIVPVCGVGSESWRKNNPTAYAFGTISRSTPLLLNTNPEADGILTEGSITATFNKALDPTSMSSLNVSLRGILGGLPKTLKSVDFDAITDKITIPHCDSLNLNKNFTIEFWIKPKNYPIANNTTILKKGSSYGVSIQTDGKLNFLNGASGYTMSTALPLNSWTHVALVHDTLNNTLQVYFGGIYKQTFQNYANRISNTDNLVIGGDGFIGQLDELRIWNNKRLDTDIANYLDKQLLGNETGLAAYYVFDDNALIVNGFQEAVRDYTGNTTGSTANGISWVTGTNAAPLSLTSIISDIPIDVNTNSSQDQIVISPKSNFQTMYLEGAKLTAVLGSTIKGFDGNYIKGNSWSFTINKNKIGWNSANLSATQIVGNKTTIEAILSNKGGTNTSFVLQNLPDWLSCTNVNVNERQTLKAGFEKKFNFETSAYLNNGTYTADIGIISYDQNGLQTGYETFLIELKVNCETPTYTFNLASYPNQMKFVSKLMVNGTQSTDPDDIVIAYYGNEIRGIGKIDKSNNLVYLTVYYNASETGNLTFNIWDASSCKEYKGITETYTLGSSNTGTTTIPVTFTNGSSVLKRIPLVTGYQWVSFNSINQANATNLSIAKITGMEANDEIKDLSNPASTVSYNVNKVVSNTNFTLDYKKGYQVKSSSNKTIFLEGIEAPDNNPITISGYSSTPVNNYVGYIPNRILSIGNALGSLATQFSNGDCISGRPGFAEYTANGWKGTLTHLLPNKAYMINLKNGGTLNYSTSNVNVGASIVGGSSSVSAIGDIDSTYLKIAANKGIIINNYKYPFTMSVTAKVVSTLVDTLKEYTLVALCNGEYRGVAKAVSEGEGIVYFMTIYGRDQENISFKLISSSDQSYDIDNKLSFNANTFVGKIAEPYPMYYTNKSIVNNELFSIDRNPVSTIANLTIKPTETDDFEISLYNLMGIKVATLFKGTIHEKETKTIELNRLENSNLSVLPTGVYLCSLKGSNSIKTLKIIFK